MKYLGSCILTLLGWTTLEQSTSTKITFVGAAALFGDTLSLARDLFLFTLDETGISAAYDDWGIRPVLSSPFAGTNLFSSNNLGIEPIIELVQHLLLRIDEYHLRVDNCVRMYVEPMLSSFRSRFPRSGSMIGSSVLDHLILVLWVMLVLQTIWRSLLAPIRYLFPRKSLLRHKRPFSAVKQSRQQVLEIDAPIMETPSPPKTPQGRDDMTRTAKKRIVNE